MSSAGRVASSSGCVARPRGRETGLTSYAEQIQHSSPTGSSVMETAEHREPYESRGSRTDLGAPGGESPPGDSTELLVLDVDNNEAALPQDEAASPGAAVAPLAAPTIPTPAASAGPLLTVAKARRTPQASAREKIEAPVASA